MIDFREQVFVFSPLLMNILQIFGVCFLTQSWVSFAKLWPRAVLDVADYLKGSILWTEHTILFTNY